MSVVVMIRVSDDSVVCAADKRVVLADGTTLRTRGTRDDVTKLLPFGDGVIGMVGDSDGVEEAIRGVEEAARGEAVPNALRDRLRAFFFDLHGEDSEWWPKVDLMLATPTMFRCLSVSDRFQPLPRSNTVQIIGLTPHADAVYQWFADEPLTRMEAQRLAALMIDRTHAADRNVGPTMDMWIVERRGPCQLSDEETQALMAWARGFSSEMSRSFRVG